MAKRKNLWNEEGGSKAVSRPQPVHVAKGWKVQPDVMPAKKDAPRRRKYAPVKPNNRAAVAVPMAGQSYNPVDDDHQKALARVVRQLKRRKEREEKVVRMLTVGRDQKTGGSLLSDKMWEEEEVKEVAPPKPKKEKSAEVIKKEQAEQRKKDKKQRKLGKKGGEREARKAMKFRRHPSRGRVAEEADEIDKILEKHSAQMETRERKAEHRRKARKENMEVKHFGRHYHTPLVEDVAPTDKLVGSLRHMSGGYVHPALDRMKSLEERNLVPARMRHRYNKRNILKPKGELKLKTETFGVLPNTTF